MYEDYKASGGIVLMQVTLKIEKFTGNLSKTKKECLLLFNKQTKEKTRKITVHLQIIISQLL